MRGRWHDIAQTVRHLAVLTYFVPLKWHDLAHHIVGHCICGNKIRASVRLAEAYCECAGNDVTQVQKKSVEWLSGVSICEANTISSRRRKMKR